MNLITEIKNRILLILLNCFMLINIIYYYKENFIYLLIINLISQNFTNFYLIYTNIFELFNIYLFIVYFFTSNLIFLFFLHQIFIFVNFGLYKKEYNFIKIIFILISISQIFLFIVFLIFIFPFICKFFINFQNYFIFNSIFLEIKINEYMQFFNKTYKILQIYLLIFIVCLILLKKYIKKENVIKFRKLYYLLLMLLIISILNELILEAVIQIFIFLLFIIYYELFLFFIIYQNIYYMNQKM